MSSFHFVFGNVAWDVKPPTYVHSPGYIKLFYGRERIVGEDGIDWGLAKLELLVSRTEGSIPTDN